MPSSKSSVAFPVEGWMDEQRKGGMRGGIDGGVERTKTFHTQIEATRYLDKVALYMAGDVLIQVGTE